MKKIILSAVFFTVTAISLAQNDVGIGTTSTDASAIFEVKSSTKGVLIPRMTKTKITAIATPAEGLMVYCTDLKSLYVYNGVAFISLIEGKEDI